MGEGSRVDFLGVAETDQCRSRMVWMASAVWMEAGDV